MTTTRIVQKTAKGMRYTPRDKLLTYEIWDTEAATLLSYCHSAQMSSAIKYARKRYPDKKTFVCREPK